MTIENNSVVKRLLEEAKVERDRLMQEVLDWRTAHNKATEQIDELILERDALKIQLFKQQENARALSKILVQARELAINIGFH